MKNAYFYQEISRGQNTAMADALRDAAKRDRKIAHLMTQTQKTEKSPYVQ